jgi:uncharacterized tellurite resistance protein B-like protein
VDDRQRAELVREIRALLEEAWSRATADPAGGSIDRRLRLAAVLLMVGVVRADLESRHDEHRALEQAVGRVLSLPGTGEEARLLVRAAEEALDGGVSFPAVLERLARVCTREEKRQLVLSLWRIAFADAELAGHEEYLVRKIAHQLGLATADLIETKVQAREAFLREEL